MITIRMIKAINAAAGKQKHILVLFCSFQQVSFLTEALATQGYLVGVALWAYKGTKSASSGKSALLFFQTARWQKSTNCCGMPFWKLSGRNWSIAFVFVYCGYFSTASQFSKVSWDRNACWMFSPFFIMAHSFPISGSDHSPFTTFINKLTTVSSKLRSGQKLIPPYNPAVHFQCPAWDHLWLHISVFVQLEQFKQDTVCLLGKAC